MILSEQERLDFYIGHNSSFSSSEPVSGSSLHDSPFLAEFGKPYKSRNNYDTDVIRYVNISKNKKLWFQCGDSPYYGAYPILVKIRDSFKKSFGILSNLNSARHWGLVPSMLSDTEWEQKENDWVWRGADTGTDIEDNPRFEFVKKFYAYHNVGFSGKLQNKFIHPNIYLDEYYKDPKPINFVSSYKYQAVVEGNDKSSALNWILASNCVPIMSKPRFHSWLCEKYLVPGVHYVECERNFSNFLDKIQWCKDNDKKAKEIALNGRRFIYDNFGDPKREYSIEKSLIEFVENKK